MCEDLHGTRGLVGVDLVGAVGEGERLLVHGGVAIARVEEER
jgi:hydrogenase maturation factor